MKQLSALGARRHAFFRGPRRMRPLGSRLDEPDLLGPGGYGYYGGMKKKKPFYSLFHLLVYPQSIALHIQNKRIFFSGNINPMPHLEITKDLLTLSFFHRSCLFISLRSHPATKTQLFFMSIFPLFLSISFKTVYYTQGLFIPVKSKNVFQATSLIRFLGTQ